MSKVTDEEAAGGDTRGFCSKLCSGDADGFALNCVCMPFVLLWNGISIYILSCCSVLSARGYRMFCGPIIKLFSCCCSYQYTDTEFEGAAAIGQSKNLDWVRASEVVTPT